MTHNELYKSIILQEAKKVFPNVRKRTYSLEYYLDHFCELLNDVVKWESLKKLKSYKSKKDFHWKTIQNEFYKWVNNDIFVNAHNKFIKKYYFVMKPKLKKLGIKLYIDTTSIWNKYGIENVGINPELRKKKVTKIGTLVDDDGDLISIMNMVINTSDVMDDNDNFLYVKHTFDHDVLIMQELFDNIIVDFDKRKKIICGGDKAFKTQKIIKHGNLNVEIITPKRKKSNVQIKKEIKKLETKREICYKKLKAIKSVNTKKYIRNIGLMLEYDDKINNLNKLKNTQPKYTKKQKELLKRRYLVETNNCSIKKFERIALRKDHCSSTFMSFILIANLKIMTEKYHTELENIKIEI